MVSLLDVYSSVSNTLLVHSVHVVHTLCLHHLHSEVVVRGMEPYLDIRPLISSNSPLSKRGQDLIWTMDS